MRTLIFILNAISEMFLMSDWRGGRLRPAYQSGILHVL